MKAFHFCGGFALEAKPQPQPAGNNRCSIIMIMFDENKNDSYRTHNRGRERHLTVFRVGVAIRLRVAFVLGVQVFRHFASLRRGLRSRHATRGIL